jgi:ABC-type molybdate transport system permease subunit
MFGSAQLVLAPLACACTIVTLPTCVKPKEEAFKPTQAQWDKIMAVMESGSVKEFEQVWAEIELENNNKAAA